MRGLLHFPRFPRQGARRIALKFYARAEFQKIELGKRGLDTSQVISRRANILARLASLELDALRAEAKTLDPWSEPMQKVFALWTEDLKKAVLEVLQPEQADALFTLLEAKLQDWEAKVEDLVR